MEPSWMGTERVRVIVLGTGTDIGKTHVACSLVREWRARGRSVVGLKPVASGVADASDGDHAALGHAGMFHVKHSGVGSEATQPQRSKSDGPELSDQPVFHVKHPLYCFREPISPHLAARRAGVTIDLHAIRDWVAQRAEAFTIVESAGGAFSPLAQAITVLDMATSLGPAFRLLVAPDRLGVLHDVTATMRLAAQLGTPFHGLVLCAPAVPDSSTGHNADELSWLGIADPVATFPRESADALETRSAAAQLATAIEQHHVTQTLSRD